MTDESQQSQENIPAEELEIVPEGEEGAVLIKKLRERLKKCEAERGEYLAGWQRTKADFINARKDEERSREEFRKFVAQSIVEDLLDIADNFETAFAAEFRSGADDWMAGMRNIQAQLMKLLKDYGVEPYGANVGEKFNPAEHDAIERVPVDKAEEDGMVMQELRRGYKMCGKILRPLKVKVGVYEKK